MLYNIWNKKRGRQAPRTNTLFSLLGQGFSYWPCSPLRQGGSGGFSLLPRYYNTRKTVCQYFFEKFWNIFAASDVVDKLMFIGGCFYVLFFLQRNEKSRKRRRDASIAERKETPLKWARCYKTRQVVCKFEFKVSPSFLQSSPPWESPSLCLNIAIADGFVV